MIYPDLAILILTYMRTEEALGTIRHLIDNLGYEKEKRGWYIADDGSEKEHIKALLDVLKEKDEKVLGHHNKRYSPTCGVGWNRGLATCHTYSKYILILEDDWLLAKEFKLHPYIQMLHERDDVGLVRLGGIAVGNTVDLVGHNGHHYIKYHRDKQYAFSGNPHIRHERFTATYGMYSEAVRNPGELELDMDGHFRAMDGPDIWRPFDIPGWGIFQHIGQARYR